MAGPEKPPAPESPGKADVKETPPKRRDRWWHWFTPLAAIVVPFGVLAGGTYFVWQERVPALQLGFPYIATALGWDAGNATIEDVSQDGLKVRDLALGSDGSIVADEVTLRFSPSGLLDRRVESMDVRGLRLSASLEDGRLVLPLPFATKTNQEKAQFQLPALPFDEAIFRNVAVALETPGGAVEITGTGQLQAAGHAGARLELAISAEGPDGLHGQFSAQGSVANDGPETLAVDLVFDSEGEGLGLAGAGGGRLSGTIAQNGDADLVFDLADTAIAHMPQGIEVTGLSGNGKVVTKGGVPVTALVNLSYQSLAALDHRLKPGRASLVLEEGAVAIEAIAALPWADLALEAEGHITDAALPVVFTARGNTKVAPLLTAAALPYRGAGDVGFDLQGAISAPQQLLGQLQTDPLVLLDGLTLGGRLDLDVRDIEAGDGVTGAGATGALLVDLKPGAIMVEARDGLTLALDRVPVLPAATRVAGLDKALAGPYLVELGGDAGTRPVFELTESGDGYAVTMETGFHWPALFDGLRGEVSAAAEVGADMSITSLSVPYLLANLDGVAHMGLEGVAEILLSDVTGDGENIAGQISLGVTSPGGGLQGIELGTLAFETDGPFEVGKDGIRYAPSKATRLSVARLEGPGDLVVSDPTLVQLIGNENAIELPTGGKPVFEVSLAPMNITLAVGDVQEVDMTLGVFDLVGHDGILEGALARSQLSLPGQPVRITDMSGDITIDVEGKPTAKLRVAEIRHTENPSFVVPLGLVASVTPRDGGDLDLKASLADKSGRINVVMSGTHDPDRGIGKALVELKPMTFLPTVMQPEMIFPVLRGRTEAVDADVAMSANLSWADGAMEMPAVLSVALRDVTTSELHIENTSADIEFVRLFPPMTPPNQEIQIGLADVGVPLSDGRLVFQLLGDRMEAQVRELDMFGGLLNSEPFVFEPGMDPFSVVLSVNGVELDELLSIAKLGDISASGSLDGVIPVFIEKGEVAVRGGVLTSGEAGGILRYKPKDVGPALQEAEFSTGLFLQAVENFHYKKVRVTLDEGDAEDLVLGFHLEGKNPDLYGGAPFELNVNLTGPLRELLDRGIKTYKLPDRIRNQVIGTAGG